MSTSSNSFRPQTLAQHGLANAATLAVSKLHAGLTLNGCVLFVVGLAVALSAFLSARLEIGGLLLHPYLILLGVAACYVVVTRIAEFPTAALVSLAIFTLMYSFATLNGPSPLKEITKVVTSAGTIVAIALLVRSEKDFRAGTLGLLLAVTGLAIYGLLKKHESFTGVDPIQGTNENAFSLYTLPPLLLAGYIAIDKEVAKWFRVVLLACSMVLVLAMFSNANRSGWVGAAFVGLMLLFRERSLRAVLSVAAMFAIAYFVVIEFGDLNLLSFRAKETFSNKSDVYRWHLFWGCMDIGLNNPLLGVSPQMIPNYLMPYVGEQKYAPDPHNVFASIWAGTGVITSAALGWFAWSLWRKPPLLVSLKPAMRTDNRLKATFLTPHRLLQMALLLWIMRGLFTREILYSPAFCIGIGLSIGLCISRGLWTTPAGVSRPAVPGKLAG